MVWSAHSTRVNRATTDSTRHTARLRAALFLAGVRSALGALVVRWRELTGSSAASGSGGLAIEARRESAPAAQIRSEAAVRAEHSRQLSPAGVGGAITAAAIERRGSQALATRRAASAGALLQNHSLLGDHTGDTFVDHTGDTFLAVD